MDATAAAKQAAGLSVNGDEVPASLWPADGGTIDRFDKSVSRCIFRLQIGPFEWPMSVPGCIFGSAPILIVGPLTLAATATKEAPSPKSMWTVLIVVWGGVLYAWFSFCCGRFEYAKRFLFAKSAYLFGPLVGLLFAALAGREAWSVGGWFIMAWSLALVPVLALKSKTRRRRPAVCVEMGDLGAAPRAITAIPIALLKDPNASFPSGDVAGAAAFGIALGLGCDMPITGAIMVACSAFGRMYWRAHHALDVIVGAGIGGLCSVCLHKFVVPVHAVRWWQPAVAQISLLAFLANAFKAVKQ